MCHVKHEPNRGGIPDRRAHAQVRPYLGMVMVSWMVSAVSWRRQFAFTPACFIRDRPRLTVLRKSRTSLSTMVGFRRAGGAGWRRRSTYSSVLATVRPPSTPAPAAAARCSA